METAFLRAVRNSASAMASTAGPILASPSADISGSYFHEAVGRYSAAAACKTVGREGVLVPEA